MNLAGPDDTLLRSLTLDDAGHLFTVINRQRAAFDPWLRWSAALTSIEAAATFISASLDRERQGTGFHLGLWREDKLLGGVPCWALDSIHRTAELGYWLVPSVRGRRLADGAVGNVVEYLFAQELATRVEFLCRTENAPSRRLAERLGAQLEGVRRESHFVAGAFRDHALYFVLAREWLRHAGL